jgi:hypothetical protein
MTPLRKRLMGAVVMVLMVLALTTNVAAANESGSRPEMVPYDPGLLGERGALSPY